MKAWVGTVLLLVSIVLHGQQAPVPNSSISGRIVPQFTRVGVGLARYGYDDDGEPKLTNVAVARTSLEIGKFGEYRFENVEPGEYYIYFNPSFLSPSAPKGEAFPTIYYPGAQDLATATNVIVRAGAPVQLGDLNLFSVRAPSVRVRIVNATGDPDIAKGCVTVTLKQRGTPDDALRPPLSGRCGTGELLSFNLGALAPGMYDLYAGWAAQGNSQPAEGAVASFEVRNLDLDVEVVVSRARVSGTIMIEEPDGSFQPAKGLQMNLSPKREGLGPTEWVETEADGSFLRDRVGRNEYIVEFTNLPPNAYVAQLRQDTRDLLENGLEVGSTDVYIDGRISFAGATLEGVVSNTRNEEVPHAVVALIPDAALQSKHLYRAVKADENGGFTIRGIVPGSYHLFAWSKLNGAAYKNAEFMNRYETGGQAVTLERNNHFTVDVKLLD